MTKIFVCFISGKWSVNYPKKKSVWKKVNEEVGHVKKVLCKSEAELLLVGELHFLGIDDNEAASSVCYDLWAQIYLSITVIFKFIILKNPIDEERTSFCCSCVMSIIICKPLLSSIFLRYCEYAFLCLIEIVTFMRFENDSSTFISLDTSFSSNNSFVNFYFSSPILRFL